MGVTLERVQNKFACIIGELCSEPIVLSQFAVWVDLRISEYKTNGTISLDCSGDSPNPIWMKGVKNGPQRGSSNSMDTGQGPRRRRGSFSNSPNLQSPSASPLSNQMYNERLQSADSQNSSSVFPSRLSPDIVVIKEEPGSDQITCSLNRKRQSESDLQSEYYSPAKSRRHGNASFSSPAAQESSSNQSLMSIINTETDSVALETVENEGDIFKVTMEMQDELNQSQGFPQPSSSNSTFSPRRPSATATSTSNSPVQSAWPTSYVTDPQQGTSSQAETGMEVQTSGQASRDQILRALYPNIAIQHNVYINPTSGQDGLFHGEGQMPVSSGASSSRLANGAMKTFKRWLIDNKGMADSAKLEEVSPDDLDAYLTEFLSTIRKQDGSDYKPNSLRSLRQGIDFYLKDHGYPLSIVGSPQFTHSQLAYKARMNALLCVTSSLPPPLKLSLSLCQNASDTNSHDKPM